MKRLLLLTLAAIPLFAYSVKFIYCDYDYDYDDEYYCEEYWGPEPYYCDGYWVYYPHGYYCVYYVWYHPWWWDWYWWHCHWCHHFDWHFFRAGFYVVWYEDGCWWWRPRYGRVVRYKLPYTYHEFKYKARAYGVNLPDKQPREINIPYNEKEVQRLTKEKDPQLYERIVKEHKSGNLEKIKQEYERKVNKEIAIKNEEYKKTKTQNPERETRNADRNADYRIIDRNKETPDRYDNGEKSLDNNTRIVKRPKIVEDADKSGTRKIGKQHESDADETDRGKYEPKRSTAKPRINEEDSGGKYEKQRNYSTPIRNLPPTNPEDEKRSVNIPDNRKSRR